MTQPAGVDTDGTGRRGTQVVLTPAQVRIALDLCGLDPAAHSPLRDLRLPASVGEDHPGFRLLVERALVRPRPEGGWRPNILFRSALAAAAQPDVAVTVQPDDLLHPALILCRRGEFVVECSRSAAGLVNLAFPLTVRTASRALAEPLGGADGGGPPDVHVSGDAAQMLVLRTLLRERAPVTRPALLGLLREALRDPEAFLPAVLLGGGGALVALGESLSEVDRAVDALVTAGAVLEEGDVLEVAPAVRAVLGAPGDAGVTVTRREADGTTAFHLGRHAGHLVLFRRLPDVGGEGARFEWIAVGRAAARALLAATILGAAEVAA